MTLHQMREMKSYVPDPEKWERYFQDKCSSPSQMVVHGSRPAVIPIEDKKPSVPKSEIVSIEAVTPVQRQNERVESELRRIGALATLSKERKRKRKNQRGGSAGRKLKRVSSHDTSGF